MYLGTRKILPVTSVLSTETSDRKCSNWPQEVFQIFLHWPPPVVNLKVYRAWSLSFDYMYLFIYLFIYLLFNSKSQIQWGDKGTSTLNDICLRHEIFTSLRRMPRDWETVNTASHETVHRNRIKLVATEKSLNSQKCLITLYIAGWVIIYNYFIPFWATVKIITHEVLWMTRWTVSLIETSFQIQVLTINE